MKNILVTGANGQLGNEMRVLSAEYKEYTCFFTDVAELDICDEQAVMTFVKENNIHVIVNCAAYTAVDKAEDDIELCTKLNKNAVSYLAKAAEANWGEFIQISTDYVFDGTKYLPYNTTIRNADEILVVADNGIAERGTHEELLKQGGIYAHYNEMG